MLLLMMVVVVLMVVVIVMVNVPLISLYVEVRVVRAGWRLEVEGRLVVYLV